MKQTTITILLLIILSFKGQCQKWHLERIDNSSKYKYEYSFNFDNIDDSTTYILERKNGNAKSTIRLTNNNNDTIVFASVKIRDLGNDSIINILIDEHGFCQTPLNGGNYDIVIRAINYDNFIIKFNLKDNEYFNLNAKLGLAPELTKYIINSKFKLSEEEIAKIMNCVKESKERCCKDCSKNKKYFVLMEF